MCRYSLALEICKSADIIRTSAPICAGYPDIQTARLPRPCLILLVAAELEGRHHGGVHVPLDPVVLHPQQH